jgi:acylphosphatase
VTGDLQCRRIRIHGRVQGVGYRVWAQGEAEALGLSGWVRNCRTGEVEAMICGAPETVEAMIEACRRGPPGALVERVEIVGDAPPVAGPFTIAPTR